MYQFPEVRKGAFTLPRVDVPGFIDVRRYSLERLSSDVREVEAWGKEVRMASAKADNFINPAYADELDAQIARWRKVLDTALATDGLALPVPVPN